MALQVQLEKEMPGFALQINLTAGSRPVGILGASGAGKTMTLRAIAGLESGLRGRIVLDGRTLFDSAQRVNLPSRIRRIGFCFQHYALFPHMSVEENIQFGIRHVAAQERAKRVAEQIAAMHLAGLERHRPAALSGGQQQRVALARALAPQPEVLMLDEPFSALDTHLRSQLEAQLRETLESYNGVALLVSHNLEEIYRLCEELVVLEKGRVIAQGPREEIFRRPPNRATAQLTGCKNFSRTRVLDAGRVEALDWGCTLRVTQDQARTTSYVAIRAHHVCVEPSPAAVGAGAVVENTLPCWLVRAVESPFRVTLYLRLDTPPTDASDYTLQVEVTQEQWAKLRERGAPWSAYFAPDRLILLPQ